MSRANLLKMTLAAAAAAGVALSTLGWTNAKDASVGPPWVSIQFPANPMDPATRGAALIVRTFHHEYPAGVPVRGTAEGLVNGERRTIELDFRETSEPGVYAVDQNWPAEGDWVLAISADAHGGMSLLAELGPNGGVERERFYEWTVSKVSLRSVRPVPGEVGAEQIETALEGR